MDADHIAAIVGAILAIVLLAWGIRRHLIQGDTQLTILLEEDSRDFDSDAARRYHESNQLGR